MNKKEVLEIRKQFTPEHAVIDRVCGCYVDGEKNKRMELSETFLSLAEEEVFKYCEIFKKTLSGTLGKNLLNVKFPLYQEENGGTQNFLLELRDSRLRDETLLNEFYDKVIESYIYSENYIILLAHGIYDIPGKASDNTEIYDASDEVYSFVLCSICPVKLSKPGLSYKAEKNQIESRDRDWVIDAPVHGFLFPAFNDRSTDIHEAIYYDKKAKNSQKDFIHDVLGCADLESAEEQKEFFGYLIEKVLRCDFDTAKRIYYNIAELLEENKESPEVLELSMADCVRVLMESGVQDREVEEFEEEFGEQGLPITATNIINPNKLTINTPNAKVVIDSEYIDRMETRMIDGGKYLLIPVDDHIEVNDIVVRTFKTEE